MAGNGIELKQGIFSAAELNMEQPSLRRKGKGMAGFLRWKSVVVSHWHEDEALARGVQGVLFWTDVWGPAVPGAGAAAQGSAPCR